MNIKVGTAMMAAALVAVGSAADTVVFGSGINQFSMDFVDIGNTGVGGDTANTVNGANPGAVNYNYKMGTYEVTIDQFAKANAEALGTLGNGDENPYSLGVNGPASNTSWLEAAKFANYLTSGTYNGGAYQFSDVNTLTGVDRASAVSTYGTVYVLPTEDEWYKAAYLKSDGSAYTLYATGDSVPTAGAGGENYNSVNSTPWDVGSGIAENNGTFDMNGNIREWNESAWDGTLDNMGEDRVRRGGGGTANENELRSSTRINTPPWVDSFGIGFRVAAIPEPSSIAMVGVVSGLGLFIRRRLML